MAELGHLQFEEEDARGIARNRLADLRRLLELCEERVQRDSLLRVEADFQVMAGLCQTAASQLLRILMEAEAVAEGARRPTAEQHRATSDISGGSTSPPDL